MANYTPTFEHVIIKGKPTALAWICKALMALDVDFQFSRMDHFISFVQADYHNGELTPLQSIIINCPSHSWDIVNQFGCAYTSILHR